MRRGAGLVLIAVGACGVTSVARADSLAISLPDERRTHATMARWTVEATAWVEHLSGPGEDFDGSSLQVGIGPRRLPPQVGLSFFEHWSARVRLAAVSRGRDVFEVGPLTLAAQRFYPHRLLSVLPLAHVQSGLELAFSTP